MNGLTTAEVAANARVSVRTVLHRAKVLGLKPARQVGHAWLWSPEQAEQLALSPRLGRPKKSPPPPRR